MKKVTDSNYSNPTIIEALCVIHFSPTNSASKWDGKLYGHFLAKLGEEYDMEPKKAPGSLVIQNTGMGEPVVSRESLLLDQMIYRHKNIQQLVQLAPWVLTVNQIGKYESWAAFEQHIKYVWNVLASVVEHSEIKRIGMRYINRLPRQEKKEKVGDWIQNTGLVPNRILEQNKNFFFRCEIPENDHTQFILTLAEERCDKSILPIIFDLDITSTKILPMQWEQVMTELNCLHKAIRREFDQSLSEKYINHLYQKLKIC